MDKILNLHCNIHQSSENLLNFICLDNSCAPPSNLLCNECNESDHHKMHQKVSIEEFFEMLLNNTQYDNSIF